ncbi:MAG: hypothetical protein C0458_07745 [Methylobacterium sp.]|nr:hypothetical protein [Methylobacterium sp.]
MISRGVDASPQAHASGPESPALQTGVPEAWLRYYNEDRPHGAIGNRPPMPLQNPGGAPSSPP